VKIIPFSFSITDLIVPYFSSFVKYFAKQFKNNAPQFIIIRAAKKYTNKKA